MQIVRVELKGTPNKETYNRLHAQMESQGFERTILGQDRTLFRLPPGEYLYARNGADTYVRSLASAAAKAVWHDYSVLVVPTNGCCWENLDRVIPPSPPSNRLSILR